MTTKIRPSVKLVGTDGNAFAILGKVSKAAGMTDEAKAFMAEAMSGDYNHLLQTAMKYCEVS